MSDLPEQTELFGGWTLRASEPLADLRQWQLRFEGADEVTGDVPLVSGKPFELYVTGQRWTVTVLTFFPFPSPGGFWPRPPVRITKRAGARGALETTIEGQSGSDIWPSRPLILVCEHDDPHPPPLVTEPPWDFRLEGLEPPDDVVEII